MAASRKLYVSTAQHINEVFVRWLDKPESEATENVIAGLRLASRAVADAFAADNPAFDRARFQAACEKVQS